MAESKEMFTVYLIDMYNVTGDKEIQCKKDAENVTKFEISTSSHVRDLKQQIYDKYNYSLGEQRLLFLHSSQDPLEATAFENMVKGKRKEAFQKGMSKEGIRILDETLRKKQWKAGTFLKSFDLLNNDESWASLGFYVPWVESAETWILLKKTQTFKGKFSETALLDIGLDDIKFDTFTSHITLQEYLANFQPPKAPIQLIQDCIEDETFEDKDCEDFFDDISGVSGEYIDELSEDMTTIEFNSGYN